MSPSPDAMTPTLLTADLDTLDTPDPQNVDILKASSKRWSAYGWKGCLRDMPNLPLDLLYDVRRLTFAIQSC